MNFRIGHELLFIYSKRDTVCCGQLWCDELYIQTLVGELKVLHIWIKFKIIYVENIYACFCLLKYIIKSTLYKVFEF